MTQAQAHTGSYYAATVNEVTDYAPLRGSMFPVNSFIIATEPLSEGQVNSIKPIVIPGAHTFRNQMVALGVLYYQIKDKF